MKMNGIEITNDYEARNESKFALLDAADEIADLKEALEEMANRYKSLVAQTYLSNEV